MPGARRKRRGFVVWYCNHLRTMDFLVMCADEDWSLGISAATVYLSVWRGFFNYSYYSIEKKCILSCSDLGLRLLFMVTENCLRCEI